MAENVKPEDGHPKGSVQVPLGLPGQPEYFTVVTSYGEGDPRNEGPEGKPGLYRAVITLNRPGIRPVREYETSFENGLRGNSHLGIASPFYMPPGNPGARVLRFRGSIAEKYNVLIDGHANEAGFLAKLEVHPFEAASFQDAHRKSYRLASLNLSLVSIQLDVPLCIFQCDVTELRTGNCSVTHTNPNLEVPCLIAPQGKANTDFQALAALYREALGTTSLIYQYLCFYKVIDAVQAVRKRAARAAKKAGRPCVRPREFLPSDPSEFIPWLTALFRVHPDWQQWHFEGIFRPEVRGRPFDELLGPTGDLTRLRNEIAHVLTERTQDLVNIDDAMFHERVHLWLPVLKVLARRMLLNEFPDAFPGNPHSAAQA